MSHFEPVEITVRGRGIFPRFALDLPRTIPDRAELLHELIAQAEKDLVASEGLMHSIFSQLNCRFFRVYYYVITQRIRKFHAMFSIANSSTETKAG